MMVYNTIKSNRIFYKLSISNSMFFYLAITNFASTMIIKSRFYVSVIPYTEANERIM